MVQLVSTSFLHVSSIRHEDVTEIESDPILHACSHSARLSTQTVAVEYLSSMSILHCRADTVASNCIFQVAGATHFWRFLHSAFAIVTSFRATAVMMTLCGFPAFRSRFAKTFILGL